MEPDAITDEQLKTAAAIFVERGIADLESLQFCSLSAEPCEGASFVCTVFEVEDEGMDRFREREEEFELVNVPVSPLEAAPSPPPSPREQDPRVARCDPSTPSAPATHRLVQLRRRAIGSLRCVQ